MAIVHRNTFIQGMIVGMMFLSCACSAPAEEKKSEAVKPAAQEKVLAVIDGKAVTEAEVAKSAEAQMGQIEHEYQSKKYDLLKNALDAMIQERLLEKEAAAKNVSKESLLSGIKTDPVTDADVDAFYEQNKAQIPQAKDQVAPQIKNFIDQQRRAAASKKFFDELSARYKVEVKLEPLRVKVEANGPAMGPADAPVTLVEFSDFQCPFCSRLIPTLKQAEVKYGDKIRLVFRQFPLSIHPFAPKAAEASLCANEQGKFWQMHDAMFGNQQALGVDQLKAKAVELGMNAEQFNTCLDSGKYAKKVQEDTEAGSKAGVNGTPALFINGRFVSGAVPLEQITNIIDDELKRHGTPLPN